MDGPVSKDGTMHILLGRLGETGDDIREASKVGPEDNF
jgi:hypothetical protein